MFRPFVAVLILVALNVSTSLADGDCQVFMNEEDFEIFNEAHGKELKGVEDFEESNIEPDSATVLSSPLQGNVPNIDEKGDGFPTGLEQKNLIVQSNGTNLDPYCSPPNPNPIGFHDIILVGPGFGGSNSEKVGAVIPLRSPYRFVSLDLIFTEDNHSGVGFELGYQPVGKGGWHITVYDKRDEIITEVDLPEQPAEPTKGFFGVSCVTTIGRINVCELDRIALTRIDNIQMWREGPVPVQSSTWGEIKTRYDDQGVDEEHGE